MKKHQLLVALVVVGAFAATGKAELLFGTGIVRDVQVISGKAPNAAGDGWVMKTVQVDIEEPASSGAIRESWDTFSGGFVSDADFWNFEQEPKNNAFTRDWLGDYKPEFGTEFVMSPIPNMLRVSEVDKSTGGVASGGQISTQAAGWSRGENDPETVPIPTPTGEFDFAILIIPEGATFTTLGYEAPSGPPEPIVGGSIDLLKGGKVVGTIQAVPEPSSIVLMVLGLAGLGTLICRHRKSA